MNSGALLEFPKTLPDTIDGIANCDEEYPQIFLSERLANAGVLPMFGFPTRVRYLHHDRPIRFPLTKVIDRDDSVAVSQFARKRDGQGQDDTQGRWLDSLRAGSREQSRGAGRTGTRISRLDLCGLRRSDLGIRCWGDLPSVRGDRRLVLPSCPDLGAVGLHDRARQSDRLQRAV